MDKHALPAEFERYLDRLCDWELSKYEETLEEVTLPEDLYEEDLPRWEVDDEPEDYFGSGSWREELRLEELKELDPDAAIRAEKEASEEALMRAKARLRRTAPYATRLPQTMTVLTGKDRLTPPT